MEGRCLLEIMARDLSANLCSEDGDGATLRMSLQWDWRIFTRENLGRTTNGEDYLPTDPNIY